MRFSWPRLAISTITKSNMGSHAAPPFDVKKVAIVGAGPAGLAAAKYLRARSCFETITIFEQQDRVGGVWYYSQDPPSNLDVPQTTPFVGPEKPLPPRKAGEAPVFPSPMYERLHANIPKSLMNYGDQKFRSDAWVYPSREHIFEYLEKYADEVRHLIRFRTQVQSIKLRQVHGVDKWDIRAVSTVEGNGEVHEETYDAVVVANGHYSTPFIPAVPGLEAFHAAHPGVVTHSKNYRRPEAFAGQRVVVVGNGPSGLDLARQINGAGAAKVFLSVHSATPADRLAHTGATELGEIVEFLPGPGRGIRMVDGKLEEAIDAVVYCTGFLFSYPFLEGLDRQLLTTTRGRGLRGLWEHLFLIDHPTLAFPALLMKAVPFPVAEAQAAAAAAVWANELPLPPVEEMRAWEERLHEERGEALHTFPGHGGDGVYINQMHDWVLKKAATPGKTPPYWNAELRWQRSIFAEAKLAFEKQGGTARTLEELGFVYPGDDA
ncbi:thiol-specific monooxygenase [Plectosphaerella cucumerina]|uniref:Thiol-specific monooxygenase n=1 Tax=Plectosphaerella cucumerina TaxID=40658 RepID=A0A8K0TKB9_9PEZI|nr:thiol-specific monooxygenase [Plectosphaerella cucumerina]